MIESAALGKATIVGPFTANFADAMQQFLAADAMVVVPDAAGLEQSVVKMLEDPEDAAALGRCACQVVQQQQGATERHVRIILDTLDSVHTMGPKSCAMKLLDRLQRSLRPYAIANLTLYIVALQAFMFFVCLQRPDILEAMTLDHDRLFAGEWWRLFSMILIPPAVGNVLFAAMALDFSTGWARCWNRTGEPFDTTFTWLWDTWRYWRPP